MAAELEDVNLDLEKERNRAQSLEKKQKLVDKQITEWKSKYDGKEAELDQAKREGHAASTEVSQNVHIYIHGGSSSASCNYLPTSWTLIFC
jgi:competence protein ComGC